LTSEDIERRRAVDATLRGVFHIELRQFPHVTREFNLTQADLDARIVSRWLAGQAIDSGDRKWAPERARLTIYEGPALRPDEIGMGRGWANVTRTGEDVTAPILERAARPPERESALARLKEALLDRCAAGAFELRVGVEVAGELHPEWRVSERLALAEQATWELLHAGLLRMSLDGNAVETGRWQPVLLSWGTWSDRGAQAVVIEAVPQ
jgi:hypothetical protein